MQSEEMTTYNPSIWVDKAETSGVQGQFWLQSELESSLGYVIRTFSQKIKTTTGWKKGTKEGSEDTRGLERWLNC